MMHSSFKKIFPVFSILLILILFQNCREEIACFSPPEPVYFKFVDATTGENLITNGTLDPKNFTVIDQNGAAENFNLIEENNLNAVMVYVGWFDGTKNYTFNLGNSRSFKFNVVSRKLTGNCGGNVVENVEIVNQNFEKESYFYLIKL